MAWIRSGYGGYPAGKAIINLTLSEEFIGTTVTCTNGTTTITVIPTSTTELIEVNELGGWTISGYVEGFLYSTTVKILGFNKIFYTTLEYYYYNVRVSYPLGSTCGVTSGGGASDKEEYIAPTDTTEYTFKIHKKRITYTVYNALDGLSTQWTFTSGRSSGGLYSTAFTWGTINVTLNSKLINCSIQCKQGSSIITKTADTTNLVFRPNSSGTWILSATYNGLIYTKEVLVSSLSTPVNVTFNPIDLVAFGTATDSQLFDMINGYYNNDINLEHIQSVWNIGDTRTIHLDAMDATGVDESHRAQDVQIQILDFEHDILTTPINGKEKALITVDLKNCLRDATVTDTTGYNNTENGKINSTSTNAGGWHSCVRRTWCNEIFYNSLPSTLKSHVKNVNKYTETKAQSSTIIVGLPNRHPYTDNERFSYHITTDLTSPIYVTFNAQSRTESSNWDYLRFYIKDGNEYKESTVIGGSGMGKTYRVDSNEFWIYWYSDGSNHDYYGWEIDEISSIEPSTYTSLTWSTVSNPGANMPSDKTYTNEELTLTSSIGMDSDKAFLLSEIEVFGTNTYSSLWEGSEYAWYAQADSNRYKLPGWSSPYPNTCLWWERSPDLNNSNGFCCVNLDGTPSSYLTSQPFGIAPAFCL